MDPDYLERRPVKLPTQLDTPLAYNCTSAAYPSTLASRPNPPCYSLLEKNGLSD